MTLRNVTACELIRLGDTGTCSSSSLGLTLTAAELAHLESLTEPTLGFPQNLRSIFPAIYNGETMVNGVYARPSTFMLQGTDRPYNDAGEDGYLSPRTIVRIEKDRLPNY